MQRSRYTSATERLNLFVSMTWPNIQSAANTSRSLTPPRKQSTTRAQTVEESSSLGPPLCARSNRLLLKTDRCSGRGVATLTIKPGYTFRIADALLTTFTCHALPADSVSAFAGRELVLRAYRHAVAQRYRFYSYGDCMLIL